MVFLVNFYLLLLLFFLFFVLTHTLHFIGSVGHFNALGLTEEHDKAGSGDGESSEKDHWHGNIRRVALLLALLFIIAGLKMMTNVSIQKINFAN